MEDSEDWKAELTSLLSADLVASFVVGKAGRASLAEVSLSGVLGGSGESGKPAIILTSLSLRSENL